MAQQPGPGSLGLEEDVARGSEASSGLPGAQEQEQEKGAEERERAQILFFGMVGPVEAGLSWGGHVFDVALHILTVEEERKVVTHVAKQDPEHRLLAEAMMRVAYSLYRVNGQPVVFGEATQEAEFRAKLTWIASWPGTLLDAAIGAYVWAARQPLLRLEEMRADPNSEAVPS